MCPPLPARHSSPRRRSACSSRSSARFDHDEVAVDQPVQCTQTALLADARTVLPALHGMLVFEPPQPEQAMPVVPTPARRPEVDPPVCGLGARAHRFPYDCFVGRNAAVEQQYCAGRHGLRRGKAAAPQALSQPGDADRNQRVVRRRMSMACKNAYQPRVRSPSSAIRCAETYAARVRGSIRPGQDSCQPAQRSLRSRRRQPGTVRSDRPARRTFGRLPRSTSTLPLARWTTSSRPANT